MPRLFGKRRTAAWLGALLAGGVVAGLLIVAAYRLGGLAGPGRDDRVDTAQTTRDSQANDAAATIRFRDVSAETGITFLHTDGSGGRRYIVEQMSCGIATFDYDGDGLIDIYFPNGAPLPGATASERPHHALYRNLGNWKFKDVTQEAGVACTAYGLGVAVGDYDDDGRPDMYLSNFGPNVLYRNNGDGTFTDVAAQAGVARDEPVVGGRMVGGGVCFLDYDLDGRLDLYVGNYIALDCSRHVPHVLGGLPTVPSPTEYDPKPDTLYHNDGNGRFTDVSKPSGIAAHAGRSMGLIAADYDNTGLPSVFVCNDVQENFLFHNEDGARFQEVGVIANIAYNSLGSSMANMGVDCADYDNDGLLDFYTTNYQGQIPMLFRNIGNGLFEDVTVRTNAGAGCLNYVNWGAGLVDLDNDGWRDLFIGNGHTEDNIEQRDPGIPYRCPSVVLQNRRGRFVDVSAQSGDAAKRVVARGVAFEDLDNDGDLDVVILDARRHPLMLRNMYYERGGANHWLQIALRGVKTNRDGVGARVRVVAGNNAQIAEVHAGRGYQSHWGSRLHFGLGAADRIQRVEVHWPGGGVDTYHGLAADHIATLVEGAGTP
jgi:hypothetical protein